jgi:dCMP deaminase
MAKDIASWSKDESTKVGAVIVTNDGRPVSWGFNGMPMGIDDSVPERHQRPNKYKWMAHAEKNAIDFAPTSDLSNCAIFVTFFPCSVCAQSIVQKKIKTVVVDENFTADKMPPHWSEDMKISEEMLKEAGVTILTGKPDGQ